MALEEEFGCEISDKDQMEIQKVSDAVSYIQKHQAN
jgi:acyl carrier protein